MSDAHIHLLFGSDEFAITGHAAEFLKSFPDATTADMNTSRLDARLASEDELHTAVQALPFLASQRVVLLTAPSKRYTGADGHRKFITFLESVPDTTRLVILEPGGLNKKEREAYWLLKWADKAGPRAEAREFNLPKGGQMTGWIINEAKKQGGQIEPQAAAQLAEMIGEDTRQASMEIGKLLTFVNNAHPIGAEDVQAVSVVNPQGDIFSLVDALATGNVKKAQRMLQQLLERDDAFSIFGMVVRQFRLLIMAREVMDEGGNLTAVTAALGAHPFVAEKVFGQARAFRLEGLETIYRRLLKMDEEAKTSQVPLDLALEMFIVQTGKR